MQYITTGQTLRKYKIKQQIPRYTLLTLKYCIKMFNTLTALTKFTVNRLATCY